MREESFKHYLTQIESRDLEHREILKILDDLRNSISTKNEAQINQSLSHLVEYWVIHTNSEEGFMKDINYPYIEDHKVAHQRMFNGLIAILRSHTGINKYTVDDIEHKFITHIDQYDLQYSNWYKSKSKE